MSVVTAWHSLGPYLLQQPCLQSSFTFSKDSQFCFVKQFSPSEGMPKDVGDDIMGCSLTNEKYLEK